MVSQDLPNRYVDKEKLANFWRTHPDFKGESCAIIDVRTLTNPERLALSRPNSLIGRSPDEAGLLCRRSST
jgi:hypothetical protein